MPTSEPRRHSAPISTPPSNLLAQMGPMERLAHLVVRRRRRVFLIWIGLTIFGMIGAGQVSKRWPGLLDPGYSAYETNQKALHTFGTGEQIPLVLVFHSNGDVTKQQGIDAAIAAAKRENPGSRVSSYYSTGSDAYVSPTATRPSPRSTRRPAGLRHQVDDAQDPRGDPQGGAARGGLPRHRHPAADRG